MKTKYDNLLTNPTVSGCRAFLRDYEMLAYYEKARKKSAELLPGIDGYIALGYYYTLIASVYGLTFNYVCSKMNHLVTIDKPTLERLKFISEMYT